MKRQETSQTTETTEKKLKVDGHGPGGCSLWHEKKKRYCKMEAKSGSAFCGQHAPPSDERARCSFCKSYIILKKMEKHLKKCNILKEKSAVPKYFSKGFDIFLRKKLQSCQHAKPFNSNRMIILFRLER